MIDIEVYKKYTTSKALYESSVGAVYKKYTTDGSFVTDSKGRPKDPKKHVKSTILVL